MEYDRFITSINSGVIKKVVFAISDYSHYNNCSIVSKIESPNVNFSFRSITVKLTNDDTETVSFYEKFNEMSKLFNFGRKGKFTLKQVWNRIIIKSIEYE